MTDRRYYRVEYCGNTYEFVFDYTHSCIEGYRAYIVSAPSYGVRSESLHKTHRLQSGDRYYICWSNKIHSLDEMNAVVELWAKATVMYIVHGSSLDAHAARIINA